MKRVRKRVVKKKQNQVKDPKMKTTKKRKRMKMRMKKKKRKRRRLARKVRQPGPPQKLERQEHVGRHQRVEVWRLLPVVEEVEVEVEDELEQERVEKEVEE